ncbi:MAG: C25 family cysteine peptidase [Vicinamibacteria bacterium]
MRSSKSSSLRFLLLALAVMLGLSAVPAHAQGSAGFSEYMVLGSDDHVWRLMERVRATEGGAFVAGAARMNSVVSATSTADNQIIYYDHWEDGFEPNDIINGGAVTVSSITRAGAVATVTTSTPHGYATNDLITIAGANQPEYDGSFVITSTGANTFTFTVSGTPATPATSATTINTVRHQTTTLLLGDGNNLNGRVCDYSTDPRVFPCTGVASHDDTLYSGTALSLTSTQGLAGACSAPYVAPPSLAQLRCSVPTNLVSPTTSIRFGGGDRIFNSGGGLSIAHVQDPGTPLIGGGTELLNRALVKNAVAFSIPIGEDLAIGANAAFASTKYGALDIVAFDDNTSVTVTSPGVGGGTVSLVLNKGQHYTTCATSTTGTAGQNALAGTCTAGGIDGPPPPSGPDNRGVFAALALRLTAGTKIGTTGPLNALIFTGADGTFQTRHYATLPDILHATDYVTTAPGPVVNTGRVKNLFIYNPDTANATTVTATYIGGSTAIAIPPNTVRDFRNAVGPAFVPANSTVRLTAQRPFWGLTSYDATGLISDWGHAWLGVRFLRSDYTVAYSPGTQLSPITQITHAANVATVTTDINHNLTNGSSVIISGATIPVTGITNTVGSRADVTTTGTHGFAAGNQITIAGVVATTNNYNGSFTVLAAPAPTATTFSYTMTAPSSAAGGTITLLSRLNGTRTIAGVTATTFTFALAGASATATRGGVVGVCDGTAVFPCNSFNRDPVWVAGSQNNTQVRVDLNANSLWDFIDTDSDGCPNWGQVDAPAGTCEATTAPAGCPSLAANPNRCIYLVDAPGSAIVPGASPNSIRGNALRIWDWRDMDNAGTRIVSNRPVVLSWGQDVDQGQNTDPSPDNGYSVYPEIAIDLVIGIEKSVTPLRVPLAGGVASYTLAITSGDYGPLTFLTPRDTLPVGVVCANFVVGSSVITFPNLMTDTAPPTCVDNAFGPGTRSQLTWNPSQNTLGINQQTTINYQINIPAAPGSIPRSLENEGEVTAFLGNSKFNPKDTAIVNQSNLTIVKGVTDDGTPEVGEILTYTVAVQNGGTVETNVSITDAIPSFTTFVPGSINAATAVTSLSRDGSGIATVTTPTPHNYITGATVSIAGAAPGVFNGNKVITVVSPTTFTYALAGAATTATGTIQVTPSSAPLTGTYSAGGNSITWSGTPLAANAVILMTFQVQIAANTPTGSIIPNFATYSSTAISGFDSNTVNTVVVGPLLSITKSGPPGPLHPNEVAPLELTIQNTGTAFARNLMVTDNVTGGNLTYVPGTLSASLNAGPFVALTDPTDADPANVTGTLITYAPSRNVTSLTRVTTTATVTTSIAHGFTTGQAISIAGATSDPALWNGSFVITVTGPTTFQYTMTGTPVTSPAIGAITADMPLAPGSTLRIRFDTRVNLGTAGLFASNQARTTATGQPFTDSNLYQVPIIGNATITGHVFLDLNGNGVQNVGEPNLPNVSVVVTDSTAVVQNVVTDANGNYSVVVPAGLTNLNVDQTDPDIPPGVTLSTANDPQNVNAIANNTVASTPVGYAPPPISITKTSDAGGVVVPGQIVTYTVTVSNFTAVPQTNTTINDVVPPGTTFVPGSAKVEYSGTNSAFRVTEYYIDNAGTPGGAGDDCSEVTAAVDFAATTCTMTLAQPLASNYFVMIQGSAVSGADSTPANDYVSLTSAPAGTPGVGVGAGNLTASGAANRIVLTRQASTQSWKGVVTVVECTSGCTTNGFQLLDAQRVTHLNATTSGTATSQTPWTDLSRVVLMGGVSGAGCDTAAANVTDHESCHTRLFPSGVDLINWTRDATDGGMSTGTSTVMVLQWGSSWGVQRVNINGNNGGANIDIAGEYNTAAVSSVVRAKTWVWGTGHTNNGNAGPSAEGVALTLGNGVTQNLTETLVAAGNYAANVNLNFDAYVLTHPGLAVDYDFITNATGTAASATIAQATNSATTPTRMSIVTNGLNNAANDFPQPMFSSRYTTNTAITVERQRTGTSFAAWVQGISFGGALERLSVTCGATYPPTALQCTNPNVTGTNPNVATTASAFPIPVGENLVYTYQVQVNNPLAGGITTVPNTATTTTTQQPTPRSATVIDNVVRPGVKVEPNNAGFAAVPTTVAGTPILFSQNVKNTGTATDSFTVNLKSEFPGWKLELIEPATGLVIATDTDGDGTWDGSVQISTGPLVVGASKQYTVRATVPFGTVAGTENTVELTAISAVSSVVKDVGTDEITVLPGAIFGSVVLLPDHSGIVDPGGTIAYTHRLFNNTGALETFDIRVDTTIQPPNAWTATVYADTNGDGVFSPGDLALPASPTTGFVSSAAIPNGGSQILFVVTTAPVGATAGVDDVAHLTARSRSNPVLVDAVTDTTTILSATTHDLAGGGTRMASAGDLTTFPGTLYNLKSAPDRFDFSITASSLFGVDGLVHPTELWVDTDADGLPDTKIAVDTDGNGTWDQLCGAGVTPVCSAATFNNNGNGLPDFTVPANGQTAYELRRQISPSQTIWKEYATVTATSLNDPTQKDSITAQWIIAALSRASIRGLRVDASGVVEFVTGTQQNTAFFNLYETAERSFDGAKTLLNASPIVSPAPDSLLPILYRVETGPVKGPYLLIEETETNGNTLTYGPYSIVNTRLLRGLERVETQMNKFAVPSGRVRVSRQSLDRIPGAAVRRIRNRTILGAPASATGSLLLEVTGDGALSIPVSVLQTSGFPNPAPPAVRTTLTRNGVSVPFSIGNVSGVSSLTFTAESLSTDYTEDSSYILSWPRSGVVPAPTVSLTRSSDLDRPGFTRIERNSIYAVAVPAGSDPWQWDLLSGDGTTWPYAGYDPELGTFDLPNFNATASVMTPVKIRLVGVSDYRHAVSARINGFDVGSVTFEGRSAALIEGVIPQTSLSATGNHLTLVYSAQKLDGSSAPSGYVYLDYLDVSIPVAPVASTATLAAIRAYDPSLPRLNGVKYVILTHPLFRAQADRLAALKAAEGLKATVIDINAAYDRYSGGVPEPRAIAAALREVASTSGVLKYAVLFGDDSLDPRNYLGGTTVSYLPSIMGRDGASRIPNENAYADLDDDGSPDIAIGRLPVTTIEEATAVVDKIENQTATLAASGNVHVFVSDNSREIDAQFSGNALEMSQLLPPTTTSVIADVGGAGVGLARSAMFGAWRQGSTMTHYFGHGGPEIWTDEALFSVDDIPDLGSMSPMVLLAWACQSQFYQNYYGPSVNEALLLAPGAGALASFGPVGISSPEHQKSIYQRVYATLYGQGDSLGEIIRKAKVAALAADPKNQDVVDGFVFFGDPSLHLPEPASAPAPSVRPRKDK